MQQRQPSFGVLRNLKETHLETKTYVSEIRLFIDDTHTLHLKYGHEANL